MAKLICNTADEITEVPPDAFSVTESRVPCKNLPDLDLRFWKESTGRNDQKPADDIFLNQK